MLHLVSLEPLIEDASAHQQLNLRMLRFSDSLSQGVTVLTGQGD